MKKLNNRECRKVIGEIILKHRLEMNLNQYELGALVFNSQNSNDQQAISKLENGTRDLTTPELIQFSKVFKISPASFLSLIISKSK